ncbi:MAG: DGQHR domain-containing protein [Alphaproteobacteria bacterium]|nr:DGQHR domain-containing protein [Alphaproteobacteria bacterium]
MNRTKIPVIKGIQLRNGVKTVMGVITVDALLKRYQVPEWDQVKKSGYQRTPSLPRVNQLANDLCNKKRKVDLPTAVLLSIRDISVESVFSLGNGSSGVLDLGEENGKGASVLYVVDGQHRIKALEKARANGAKLKDFKLPFICMIGANEFQEMVQFHVVNSNAKSVNTKLALSLIKERARDPAFREELIEKDLKWQTEAQEVADRMLKSSLIWRGKIGFAGMSTKGTVIPITSMVKSLEPLFRPRGAYFRAIRNPETQMQIIDAYWQGVKKNLQPAFEEPKAYSLQKGVGVRVLHGIFADVLNLVQNDRKSLHSVSAYQKILEAPLKKIEGYNGNGQHVSGLDFWKSGKDGAIGQYSSGAGINTVTELLLQLLPELKVE